MRKVTGYEWATLVLFAAFILCCVLWLAGRTLPSHGWQVQTERAGSSYTEAPPSDSWPDSLLAGEIINLNTASRSDLLRLPNIGTVRADAILAYRAEHGPFRSLDELQNVDGIGPGTLETLRPFLSVD